jgi:hypothetical protein
MARAKTAGQTARPCTFTAVIEADAEDGGFVVTFPAIPNLATQGETLDEARRMAEDCLAAISRCSARPAVRRPLGPCSRCGGGFPP